jgi:hypothetical protein
MQRERKKAERRICRDRKKAEREQEIRHKTEKERDGLKLCTRSSKIGKNRFQLICLSADASSASLI